MKTFREEQREAAAGMDYRGRRAIEYGIRITPGEQLGAIIDELRALRAAMPAKYLGAGSFSALIATIDEIKADIPKEDSGA